MSTHRILFFDTETTGIPRNYRAPASDAENWPRMVQIAWTVCDPTGAELESYEAIIRPQGFVIPEDAARVHGISTARALSEGVQLRAVLEALIARMHDTARLIAHNVQFDEKIVGAELLRHGMQNLVEQKPRSCTMLSATQHCRLPGPYGYKWPSLQQLHVKLFGAQFGEAHQALSDVRACARCYFELRRLGVMQ